MNTDQPLPQDDARKETLGWLSLTLLMVLFPLLFFLCVFLPIWLGVTAP